MTDVFRIVLNMSITGGIVAIAVALLRIPLKRVPRWISCALWVVVFLRLILPFSFSSPVSILNGVGAPEPENNVVAYLPADTTELAGDIIDSAASVSQTFPQAESITESVNSLAPTPMASVDPIQIWFAAGAFVWIAGIVGMLFFAIIQYIRLYRRVSDAVMTGLNVFETDMVTSPFVIGFFKPRIILPVNMPASERELVLRHEWAHIYRYDYVLKPLAFFILAIHWFNPLVWLSFKLFCEDIEASCDERAIQTLDRTGIAAYGETLLRIGTRKFTFAGGPLAFGEHCTKGRIVNVLNYKKPMFWVIAVAVVAAIATGIVLLANPLIKPKQAIAPTIKELDLVKVAASDFDQVSYEVPENGSFGVGGNPSRLVEYGINISVLGDKSVSAESLAEFSNQLVNGQNYISAYLRKNAEGCYDSIVADGKVRYVIMNDDWYSYAEKTYPYRIRIGRMYWHCAQYYVFMILHPESLHWQHYGYAQYLGSVLNPYDMYLAKLEKLGITLPLGKYVQDYYDQGGTEHKLTNDDYRLLMDAVAYYCLENGMHWGTAYESYPITEVYGFTEPAEEGDDMSVIMASSFCAYLAEHFGFNKLTSYCAGQTDFHGAFGISFDRAYAKWEKTIIKEFS